jgi:molecular chaperone GrpE
MSNDDPKDGNTPENAGPGEAPPATPFAGNGGELSLADRLEKAEAEKRELHDRMLRSAAEFENFKRRAKKEMDESAAKGREQLLKELLPAIDNLERALKHAPAGDPVAVGVQQTEKQLLQALEKFGVVRFPAVGKPFDPSVHDAIQQLETTEFPPGTVALEFASGYMQGQRLLRPAMVAVAKAPPAASDAGQVVRLEANAEKSWSVVPMAASRPSKMLLMQGNVVFAAQARDRPESDAVRSDVRNGISAGSNISERPALSRINTTVRKRCDGSNPRAEPASLSSFSGPNAWIAAMRTRSGTNPSAAIRRRAPTTGSGLPDFIRRRIYKESSATLTGFEPVLPP